MTERHIVYVLFFEPDPDLPGPVRILGVFHGDEDATGLGHAKARAAMEEGVPVDSWAWEDSEPEVGLARGWTSPESPNGVLRIEPHVLEPTPAPRPRVGRRPRAGGE